MNGKTKPGPGTTERPILFNGAMVRAILEERKTVTRRPLNNQMGNGWHIADPNHPMATITSAHPKKDRFGLLIRREICADSGKVEYDVIVSPFGRPGDRLWVRESTEAFTSPCGAVTLARYSADHEPVTYGAELNGESFEAVAHWSYFREVCPSTPDWLKRAIRLALLSLQRREDLVTLLRTDVDMDTNVIRVSPGKTENYSAPVHLEIEMGPDLRAVVQECLADPIAGPTLLRYRPRARRREQIEAKISWSAITEDYLTKEFRKARDAAGAYNNIEDPLAARPYTS